jgi:hypothetical protein
MTLSEARRWLGLYFLLTTCGAGAVILILGGATFVPLDEADVTHSFEILIPVLLGQLTVIFQWISTQGTALRDDSPSPIPSWAIRAPAVAAIALLVLGITALVLSNLPDSGLRFTPARFQVLLTFVVSIINASTVFLVSRIFPRGSEI